MLFVGDCNIKSLFGVDLRYSQHQTIGTMVKAVTSPADAARDAVSKVIGQQLRPRIDEAVKQSGFHGRISVEFAIQAGVITNARVIEEQTIKP